MAKSYVWLDGKFIDSSKAVVPISNHSLQYGSGIFEGIRAYSTAKGPAVFRLKEHAARFMRTAKIAGMALPVTQKELEKAIVEIVGKNKLESCYIRPFGFYNDPRIGLDTDGKKISVAVIAVPFGNYFGDKDKGIRCKISSMRRINSQILPPQAKLSGNYATSVLASKEAKNAGAEEAILLSINGWVAEGPGENIFLVSDNKLITPSKASDILLGITRDSVIKTAESIGITVEEREVHREELLTAEEVFFSGTAAEITPIISIDGVKIGNGKPGPITRMLWDRFTEIVSGRDQEFMHWLTFTKQ
jgi:branched-chain amino acid aminotransferase